MRPERTYIIGDSREVLPRLRHKFDLVVTSPPYNIEYETFNTSLHQYEDTKSETEYLELLKEVLHKVDARLSSRGQVFINLKNRYGGRRCRDALWMAEVVPATWRLRDIIIWNMDIGFDTSKNKFQPLYEHVFWFTRGEDFIFEPGRLPAEARSTVWYIPIAKGNAAERRNVKHPAVFPRELVRRIILGWSEPGDWVLDPFLGSGTTVAEALSLGRNAVGVEIDPAYESSIQWRLRNVTPSLSSFVGTGGVDLPARRAAKADTAS